MKIDVVMPKMGESINEGTLIKWHKKKGDKVERDEIIFEISTDKVDTEIPSPEEGILSEIKVYENETVEVDTVVAIIETEGNGTAEDSSDSEPAEDEQEETPSTTQVGGELVDIPMPKMGESVMEGTIIKWHKEVGDKVDLDEIIFEISTDKVDTEVPSPSAGTMAEILIGENETVEVNTIVARLSTSGGIVKPKAQPKKEGPKQEAAREEKPAPAADKKVASGGSNLLLDAPEPGRFYSPLVMNIAQKEGVSQDELNRVKGTGNSGRVSKKDILAYVEARNSGGLAVGTQKSQSTPKQSSGKTVIPASEQFKPSFEAGNGIELIPMDNIRQRIMYHMVNSRDTSVHVTAVLEVDMTKIHNFIKANKAKYIENEGVKLTYMAFVAHAVIKALKEYPMLNASIDEKNIAVKKFINLGIAVAVEPNGLIVPNIKSADEKNIKGLARSVVDLSERARTKKLMPEDIMDGTFTITNYGVFGSLFGTPIINQPEVGILGVGAVTKKPVVVEVDGTDTIAIKPMMYLSLSHDHRLVDGMLGGKFLSFIKESLENFDASVI
ncbi:MAG: dihydrolipoamide acetyltransferase component of pyruvate dehydrogenase complex [Melioribacteraceae bacterium]|nr:MAG: dihydrolipoamide acetyltransferase component of pyruvate dehydrogenase complex [Melioribacteraceae bacterium]